MSQRSLFFRITCLSILALICWTAVPGVVLAQAAEGSEESPGGGALAYLAPWAVIVMCIGLGLVLVCRSSNRQSRAGPEQYAKVSFMDREDAEKAVATAKRGGLKRVAEPCKEATNALIMASVGLVICAILCPMGLIKGLQAKKMIAQNPRLTGEGQAMAAIVVGGIGTALWILGIIVTVISMMSGSAAP